MSPIKFHQDFRMQGANFSDGFALDDHVELLSPEVVVLVGGSELIVGAESQVALLQDELEVSVGFSEETAVRILLDLVCEHCGQFLHVLGSNVGGGVHDDAVSSFKETIGKGIGTIFLDVMEESSKKGGPSRLELSSLGSIDADQSGIVLIEQELSHFRDGTKGKIEHLVMLGLCHFLSKEVAELVEMDPGSTGGRFRHFRLDVLVAVTDGDILDDITGMQDICSPEGNGHLIGLVVQSFPREATPLKVGKDLFGSQLVIHHFLGISMPNLEIFVLDLWSDGGLLSFDNVDCFHFEGSATVLREAPNEGVETGRGLGVTESGDFNEDVLGIFGELGVLAVDDGRH